MILTDLLINYITITISCFLSVDSKRCVLLIFIHYTFNVSLLSIELLYFIVLFVVFIFLKIYISLF